MHTLTLTLTPNSTHAGPAVRGPEKLSAGDIFIPEVFYKGEFYPICRWDWDFNNEGARTVCKSLGFKSGSFVGSSKGPSKQQYAMPVGSCFRDQPLDECTSSWARFDNFRRYDSKSNCYRRYGYDTDAIVQCHDYGKCFLI